MFKIVITVYLAKEETRQETKLKHVRDLITQRKC